jgi:hypothetical protein
MDLAHSPAAEHRNAVPVQAVPGLGTELKTLPNQPARIAINPRDFVRDLQTGFARLQQQVARANVLGRMDDMDRDRLEQWRKDGREDADEERAE